MKSTVAQVLKIIVVIEWFIGFIVGIVVADGDTSIMFYVWISAFLLGIFQYAFAELLKNITTMRERTEEQFDFLIDEVFTFSNC